MKARKKSDIGLYDFRLWILAATFPAFTQTIASQSFSEGKNLFQIQQSVNGLTEQNCLNSFISPFQVRTVLSRRGKSLPPVFLPRWSAEKLPFFCRIEHSIAKNNALSFKFRLGSVEYVDWLEGKN